MSPYLRISLVVFSALLVASWQAPNHYPPWVAAHGEFLAACAGVALAAAGLFSTRIALSVPAPATFFLLIALVPMVQVAVGKILFFGDGWIAFLYLICVAWVIVWSSRLSVACPNEWPITLALALLAGAALTSIELLLQCFGPYSGLLSIYLAELPPGRAPYANLGQPNQCASLIGLGVVALWLLHKHGRCRAWLAVAAAALLLVAMGLTQSRTPVLIFVAVVLVQALKLGGPSWLGSWKVVLCSSGVWFASFLSWPVLREWLGLPVLVTASSSFNAGPRPVIWRHLIDALSTQPWSGFGWNQVTLALMAKESMGDQLRLVDHSHNLLLDLSIWNGIPIAALIVVVAAIWYLRRIRRRVTVNGVFAALVIALLLGQSRWSSSHRTTYTSLYPLPQQSAFSARNATGSRR